MSETQKPETTKPGDPNDATELKKKSELVAPSKSKVKMVKMEILRDTEVFVPDAETCAKDEKGKPIASVFTKGSVVEVTEAEGIRLVNKKVNGTYGFTGERDGEFPKQVLRAARPWQPPREEIARANPLDPLNFQESV